MTRRKCSLCTWEVLFLHRRGGVGRGLGGLRGDTLSYGVDQPVLS